MNFFDYELSRTATATPPQTAGESSNANEPSLNDEVSQVVGQLGRLWGGFRRQSQAAFETARKDFSSVVAQAQKEIEKLRTDASASGNAEASASSQEAGPSLSEKEAPTSSPVADDETMPQPSSPSGASSSSSSFQFQTLLHRVQTSLPPNISATLERTIPAALKDPASHAYADIQHLRETLGAEFSRVQGVTRAQAEEYALKSEALLREAGAYLKDAVRVIPPEEQGDGASGSDVVFDSMGSSVVVLPSSLGPGSKSRAKGKARETAQQHLVGSRAEAMLAQLKRDAESIKQDPLGDESAKELYESWLNVEVASKENGIESPYWTQRTKEALEAVDSEALRSTRDTLVPSTLDSNTFWTRYFFHVHQIEKDEERRKALLAASGGGNDEDFSWEDDDDESVTPSESAGPNKDATSSTAAKNSLGAANSSHDTLQPSGNGPASASYPESLVTSPSNTSPRESTDGYDVVSSSPSSGARSKITPEAKDSKSKPKASSEEKEEDDADSDWE